MANPSLLVISARGRDNLDVDEDTFPFHDLRRDCLLNGGAQM